MKLTAAETLNIIRIPQESTQHSTTTTTAVPLININETQSQTT